ncbi:MAG: plasmid stabilization protein [Pseudomonadota bacterium]|nr:plasmid stabilization protein [Pseudomonadota bacterium]
MGVTSVLIRNLPIAVKEGLRDMAALHQRSMEEEARLLITQAVAQHRGSEGETASIGRRIHARFAILGGLETPKDLRQPWRDLPDFSTQGARQRKG